MSLLTTAQQIANDHLENNIRTQIKDIIRGYRHFWDPFSEALQNSVDAINRRFRVLNDPDFYLYPLWQANYHLGADPQFTGKIRIELWPHERRFAVLDNGVGIKPEEMEKFILPEGSDKRHGKEYGYKGKGLTYLAFVSREFALISRFLAAPDTYGIAIDGLLAWCADNEGNIPLPIGPRPTAIPIQPLPDDFNTCVTVTLADNYDEVLPAVASLNNAFLLADNTQDFRGFAVVLRTKTAVGNTRVLLNQSPLVPIDVELVVHSTNATEPTIIPVPYRFYHPREHREIHGLAYSFENYVTRLRPEPTHDNTFRCLYFYELGATIGDRSPVHCDFFVSAISSTRLTHISEELGLTQDGVSDAALTYGVHLAIAGMPTGFRIDKWEGRGGEAKRYFVVADVDLQVADELDPGRKGISDTRARQISDKAFHLRHKRIGDIQGRFSTYAGKFLDWGPADIAPTDDSDFEARVETATERTTEDRQTDPETLDHVQALSSLEHIPSSEEEVRVLFHELLAKNKIKGYRTLYAAGTEAVYDSAFTYEIDLDRAENLYPNDPLGFSEPVAQDLVSGGIPTIILAQHYRRLRKTRPALCIEFKTSVEAFLRELSSPARTPKVPQDIDILIAWELGNLPESDAYSYARLPGHHRIFHSTTHRLSLLSPTSTDLLCIILKDALADLYAAPTAQ